MGLRAASFGVAPLFFQTKFFSGGPVTTALIMSNTTPTPIPVPQVRLHWLPCLGFIRGGGHLVCAAGAEGFEQFHSSSKNHAAPT